MEWLIKRLIKVGAKAGIMGGGGKSMWHQPSRWPDTSELSLDDKHFRKTG
jgi:hypothetical protein